MASKVFYGLRKANAQVPLVRASIYPELFSGFTLFSRSASSSSMRLSSNIHMSRPVYHRKTMFQRVSFSFSASSQATEKETNGSRGDNTSKIPEASQGTSEPGAVGKSTETSGDSKAPEQSNYEGFASNSEQIVSQYSKKERRRIAKRTAFSDSDTEPELSIEELVKLVVEKDNLLKTKQNVIDKMHDKLLRARADMENVLERTKREVENSKKYGIQNFAKSLLDVADNLRRASNVVKENFSKIDHAGGSLGVTLLKSLLEGVEMTEKQLAEVFGKFVIVKYEPLNEKFDPNKHDAVFEIPDASKPPGTVASVLKPGYMLHDRVLRPAEVGVTKSPPSEGNN